MSRHWLADLRDALDEPDFSLPVVPYVFSEREYRVLMLAMGHRRERLPDGSVVHTFGHPLNTDGVADEPHRDYGDEDDERPTT